MLAELLRQPGVEEDVVLGSRFGFCALHGGSLERGTAEIAGAAAARSGASGYTVRQPEDLRWHVPSLRFDPAASPALTRFLAHVEVVVSVHGYGRPGCERTILAGGTNRELATRLARALGRSLPGYRVVDELDAIPVGLRGVHPANPVNRARAGGVQLELPVGVRDGDDRDALVAALAAVATATGPAPG